LHWRKRPVWLSGRRDATYSNGKGQWYYLYRAVDKQGQTMDFRLTEPRAAEAALQFLQQAIRQHGRPETITSDGSAANEAALKRYNAEPGTAIVIRKRKDLPHVVEQDHRAVKRVTWPRLGCKACEAAQDTLVGSALMHRSKKRQRVGEAREEGRTAAALFYALAA